MEHPTREILLDFVLDELGPDETKRVQEHIYECEQCREYVREIIAIFSTLNEFKDEETSGKVRKNVLELLEVEQVPHLRSIPLDELKLRVRRRRPVFAGIAIAASLVFIVHLFQVYFPQIFTSKILWVNARLEVPSAVSPETDIPIYLAVWNEAAETASDAPISDYNFDILLKTKNGHIYRLAENLKTGADGTFNGKIRIPKVEPGEYEIIATHQIGYELMKNINIKRAYDIELMLNQPIYRPNDILSARATVRKYEGAAAPGDEIIFTFRDPLNTLIKHDVTKLDDYGVATFDYFFADIVPFGEYTLKASVDGNEIERKIIVDDYSLPAFKLILDSKEKFVTTSRDFKASVKAEYFFGKPVINGLAKVEYYVLKQDSLIKVFKHDFYTDENGIFNFTIDSNTLRSKVGIVDCVAESYFKISVEDSANRKEEIIKAFPLADESIVIKVFPEDGQINPLVSNVIYIAVSDPLGNPIKTNLEMRIGKRKWTIETSDLGICFFEYVPEKNSETLFVSAQKQSGEIVNRTFNLNIAEKSFSFIVRSKKAVYKANEELEIDILVPFTGDFVARLDLYRDTHWLDSVDVPLTGTLTHYKWPVKGEYGELTVQGALVRGHAVYGRDSACLIIEPLSELEVSIKSDKEVYSVDEDIVGAKIAVKDGKEPRKASLGISVADRRIFSAGEEAETAKKIISDTILGSLESNLAKNIAASNENDRNNYFKAVISEEVSEKKNLSPTTLVSYYWLPESIAERHSEILIRIHVWRILMVAILVMVLYLSVIIAIFTTIYNLRRNAEFKLPLAYESIVSMKVFAFWGSLSALCFMLTLAYPSPILFIIGIIFLLGLFASLIGCFRRIDVLVDNGILYHIIASMGIVFSSLLLSHFLIVFPLLRSFGQKNMLLNPLFLAILVSIGCLMILSLFFIQPQKREVRK